MSVFDKYLLRLRKMRKAFNLAEEIKTLVCFIKEDQLNAKNSH